MQVIYTISGGAWFRDSLNAIAAFVSSNNWYSLVIIATTISVVVTAFAYIKGRDIFTILKWAVIYVFITGIFIGIKKPVQVIDSSRPMEVYQVDNVPLGIVLPFSLITGIGHALVVAYETVFHQPDALTYSKTGMLFGAELMGSSTDFISTNPEIAGLFSDYVQNCVIGDMMLNHKYTLDDLMNSTDPYAIIFSNPSPLRGVFDNSGNFQTCQVAAAQLQNAMGRDSTTGGKTWDYYVRKLMGGRPDATLLFGELMGDSYSYFYNGSQSASEIMKRNVTMNALRKGIMGSAARNGDSASLVNLSAESSYTKMRMSQATSANIATRTLPIMQTVLTGIMIGMFPVIIIMALISVLSVEILKGYVFTIAYLQSWPLLFAIMNNAMNFYLQTSTVSTPVTLSNLSVTQQQYSDIGTTAGWLALSIPFLAYGIVKGLGSAVSQAGSYLGSAMQSAATQSSSQAVDGTWSFNNMQTDNVQGFKWDTNSSFANGQMTSQAGSGALVTQTGSGETVYNTAPAMSKLPMDINFGKTESSTAQRLARESQVQAESSMAGYNHTVNSAYNQAKQFSQQSGNSSTVTSGADSAQGTTETKAANQMLSAAQSYSAKNNVSESQAFSELMDMSRRAELSGSLTGRASFDTDRQVLGKIAGLATGASVGVELRGGVSGSMGSGSRSSVDDSGRSSQDSSSDQFSQEAKDFRQGMDTLKSFRVSESGSHSDNSASSQLEQLGTTLSVADSQYQQYTNSMTRSHEYSQMASSAETTTAQTQSNYAQEFVGYVQNKAPEKAEAILTDTASPEVRAEREQLAGQFMEDKLRSRVDEHFDSSRGQLSDGMSSVGNTATTSGDNTYQQGQQEIAVRAASAGIRSDNTSRVDSLVDEGNQRISDKDMEINTVKHGINSEQSSIRQGHQEAEARFSSNHEKEVEHQRLPGVENADRLTEMAQDIQAKNKDKM